MVPAYRHSEPMVQVCMVMVLAMQLLMPAGAIRGFAEALASVSAEVSVEAGAAVAAEAGGFGSRFKLALNCKKDGYLCQEEMEQDQSDKDVAADEVWVEVGAKAGGVWAAHSLLVQVEIVYAQNAVKRCRTSLESRVTNAVVPSAAQE